MLLSTDLQLMWVLFKILLFDMYLNEENALWQLLS